MKLASYNDGSRDGQLVVVSRDLSTAHYATAMATRLQQALDDWGFIAPQLEDLYATLNLGKARHAFAFEPRQCLAPLPRAHLLAWSGAAQALLRPGGELHGPAAAIAAPDAEGEVGIEIGFAALTGDVGAGSSPEAALDGVRLLTICADMTWRGADMAHAVPLANLFGPVAVTPDELGPAWQRGRVLGDLALSRNGSIVAMLEADAGRRPHLGERIAESCRLQRLRAGAIVGQGHAAEAGLRAGDRWRVELSGPEGASQFGAIDTVIRPATM